MVKFKAMFKKCLLPQQGLALAVLLIVSTAVTLGGTTAVIASQESIPGDVLYPVKETVENVQLMGALSDEGKAKVHLSIAKGKISEIEKLNSRRASADKIGIVNKKATIHLQKAQIIRGIRSFADCVNAGYPITQTFPTQCRTPDGKIFIDPLEPPEPSDIGQLLERLNEAIGKVEPLVPSEQVITPVKPSPPPEPIFCTQDAKLCPDGTYVSRIPPSCEFAPCPTLSDSRSCKSDADCGTGEICTRLLGWHPEPGEIVTAPPMVCLSKQ